MNSSTTLNCFDLDVIKDEARQLVEQGVISRRQSIFTILQYIPTREWISVELELERNDFLLRDRIGDLISFERWIND